MSQNSKDYKNGKIYCIRNNIDDDIYVGSTTQALSKRMAKNTEKMQNIDKTHRNLYVKMLEHGLEHFYIELIEDCPCETLEQLRKQEGYYLRKMGTLNHRIAGRTIHEYNDDNKDKISEQKKEYYEANKDKIKEYYEANKDKLNKK
jgi:adenylate kinase family enzyme